MTLPERSGQKELADAWVWLARIRHPQGRKGEVFADILTDFPERFADRKQLFLLPEKVSSAPNRPSAIANTPREVELIAHWQHKGGIVLHFAGIDSITSAETLKGMVVAIPQTERAPLAEDEFYIGDLIGCLLMDVAAEQAVLVGEIEDVDRTAGPVALLVVHGAAGEVLVPFAKGYLRKIDIEARRVEMALPKGLVELNAPSGSTSAKNNSGMVDL